MIISSPETDHINKLIADGALSYERNLETLQYPGPSDLIEACRDISYVLDYLKNKAVGEYLVAGSISP